MMVIAGYLSPKPDNSAEHSLVKIDPYVVKVLSEELVHVQRALLSLLTIVKAIAQSTER